MSLSCLHLTFILYEQIACFHFHKTTETGLTCRPFHILPARTPKRLDFWYVLIYIDATKSLSWNFCVVIFTVIFSIRHKSSQTDRTHAT